MSNSASHNPITYIGVFDDTIAVHFRDPLALSASRDYLPPQLAAHPLTMADTTPGSLRLFMPVIADLSANDYLTLLNKMGGSDASLAGVTPQVQHAAALVRAPNELARHGITGGTSIGDAFANGPAATPTGPSPIQLG